MRRRSRSGGRKHVVFPKRRQVIRRRESPIPAAWVPGPCRGANAAGRKPGEAKRPEVCAASEGRRARIPASKLPTERAPRRGRECGPPDPGTPKLRAIQEFGTSATAGRSFRPMARLAPSREARQPELRARHPRPRAADASGRGTQPPPQPPRRPSTPAPAVPRISRPRPRTGSRASARPRARGPGRAGPFTYPPSTSHLGPRPSTRCALSPWPVQRRIRRPDQPVRHRLAGATPHRHSPSPRLSPARPPPARGHGLAQPLGHLHRLALPRPGDHHQEFPPP